jgi:phosphate-selective porin OprO/OprP
MHKTINRSSCGVSGPYRRRSITRCVALVTLCGWSSSAMTADRTQLEARIAALEAELSALKTLVAALPEVRADKRGPALASPDGRYRFRLGGTLQSDARVFLDDGAGHDTFLLRRLRPTLQAELGDRVSFRLTPELAGDSASLVEFWIDLGLTSGTTLRFGQMKSPVSLERLQAAGSLPLIERTFGAELAANRDIGVQLQGLLGNGTATYAIGLFNGAVDGRSAASRNPDDELEVAGRIMFEPWRATDSPLAGLGFGLGASSGRKSGAGNEFLPRYRSAGQEVMFRYQESTAAAGKHQRISPQGYYFNGPFGLLAEYVASSQRVRDSRTDAQATLTHSGWHTTVSWVLTGEPASLSGPAPATDFVWGPSGGPGAWELVLRYAAQDNDRDAFPLFADPAVAVTSARSWAVGINWYLSSNLRASTNYQHTRFTGGAATGNRTNEEALLSRLQVMF